MIALTPVLERFSVDCPFWAIEPTDFYLPVPREPAPERVGTIVWNLIGFNVIADDLSVTAPDAVGAIRAYLDRDQEADFASGGLRVGDGDLVIEPGCCIGLDEWRDWLHILDGMVIDLGHDPDVAVEHRGSTVRIWQDRAQPRQGARHLDFPRDDLSGMLRAVRDDLGGFLGAVRPWAREIVGDMADPLAEDFDRRLRISEPLGI